MPQLVDVLFDDLKSSKKNINRILSAGLFFAFIAHFYVVEPYFEYKEQEILLGKLLVAKKEAYDGAIVRLNDIENLNEKIKNTLKKVKDEIEEFPVHLRGILPEIDSALNIKKSFDKKKQFKPPMINGEPLPSGVTEFEPAVQWYVNKWFDTLVKDLEEGIIAPVKQAKFPLNVNEMTDLGEIADEAKKMVQEYLDTVPSDFWRNFSRSSDNTSSKEETADGLEKVVKGPFGSVEKRILSLVKAAQVIVNEEKDRMEGNNKKLKACSDLKTKLDSRIDSIDSPFGKIPADTADLIKLFPLLLAGLLITVTVALQMSNRLRISFWQELKKNRKDNRDDVSMQQFVHCWYLPPYKNIFLPGVLGFCITALIGIFVRTAILVMAEPALFTPFSSSKVDNSIWYLFLSAYIVGFLMMLGCLWFICKTFQQRI